MAHCDVVRHRPERSARALVHPAPATASHRSHTQQDSVTDTRTAHWQRLLCTAGQGAAHGAGDMLSYSVHAALYTCRLSGLPRALRLQVDRGVHTGRAAAGSCGTGGR
eukprot:7387653-Prymnesium_polylepis.3